MTNTEKKLRNEILSQLKNVTPENSPHIYNRIQNAYEALENEIIEKVIATGMQPAAVIPQMEQEAQMI